MSRDELPVELHTTEARRAYAYVLGQYLGDGCISEHRRKVFRLRITCAAAWPAVMDRIEDELRRLMPANKVGRMVRHGLGCVEISMYSKKWPVLIPQGVGRGPKHLRSIRLAPWQERLVHEEHPAEFVCGLIHSDGCRVINRIRTPKRIYEYPRYMFSNRSEDIHELFSTSLSALGVTSTRSGWDQSVATSAGVTALDAIGARKER